MRAVLVTMLASLTVLLGCPSRVEPPPPVPPPQILAFTATPAVVKRGALVTLSWETKDASSVEIRRADQGVVSGVEATTGSVQITADADALYVLVASNAEGLRDSAAVRVEVEEGPSSVLFTASPSRIRSGEPSILAWHAPGATEVTLAPKGGAALELGGQIESGSVEVTPTVEQTYVLTVNGTPFETTVHVAPEIQVLSTSPSSALPGTPISVSWKTSGAARLTLSLAGVGDLATETEAGRVADGSIEYMVPTDINPAAILTFQLRAESETSEVSTRDQAVYVTGTPQVRNWKVPPYALAGDSFKVTWTTTGADAVEILRDGVVVHHSPTVDTVAQGELVFPTPTKDVRLQIRALNARGGEDTSDELVVSPVGLTDPANSTFTASPQPGIAHGGEQVTLAWSVPNARHLKIVAKDQFTVHRVDGVAAETGSIEVYPNKDTEYVLSADNGVASSLPARSVHVAVTTPAKIVFSPARAVPNGAGIEITGTTVPNPGATYSVNFAQKNVPSDGFVDISSTGTAIPFKKGDDSTSKLVTLPSPFAVNWAGDAMGGDTLCVSINGWFDFGSDLNSDWSFPYTPSKGLVAPYGSDLVAASTTKVHWQLDGTIGQRRLIVQWTDVGFYGSSNVGKVVTFQAQVYESGPVVFAYQNFQGTVLYNSVRVGIVMKAGDVDSMITPTADQLNNTGYPVPGDTFQFFGAVSLPFTYKASSAPMTVSVEVGNGRILVQGAPDIFAPGQFSLSEVNHFPATGRDQWFEVLNNTAQAIDLDGWEIAFDQSVHLISSSNGTTLLPPNGRLVFGQSANATEGASVVDYVYGSANVLPSSAGSMSLGMRGAAYASADWSGNFTQGATWQYESPQSDLMYYAGAPALGCVTPAGNTYGTHGQRGTPRAVNGRCFPYTKSSIPGAFQPILGTGTQVGNLSGNSYVTDHTLVTITLTRPVTIWGKSVTTLYVASDGFVSTDPVSYWSYNADKTSPSPEIEPVGAIAPFYDDLMGNASNSMVMWQQFDPNGVPNSGDEYTLISWENWGCYYQTASLNFQVRFVEATGAIEFHYGSMTAQNPSYADGSHATAWIEAPTGTEALAIGTDTPGAIQPNSGFRFTPL